VVTHWADLAAHILPRRYHWLITPNTMIRGREINRNITDTTVTKAFRICCAGLMSGLTSPSRPWFKLGAAASNKTRCRKNGSSGMTKSSGASTW